MRLFTLKQFAPHFSPNSGDIAYWMVELNATLDLNSLYNKKKTMKEFITHLALALLDEYFVQK